MEPGVWFLSFHCFDRYVKVAFFRGAALTPEPPVGSRQKDVRYWHVHEGDEIDEGRVTEWVRQASGAAGGADASWPCSGWGETVAWSLHILPVPC